MIQPLPHILATAMATLMLMDAPSAHACNCVHYGLQAQPAVAAPTVSGDATPADTPKAETPKTKAESRTETKSQPTIEASTKKHEPSESEPKTNIQKASFVVSTPSTHRKFHKISYSSFDDDMGDGSGESCAQRSAKYLRLMSGMLGRLARGPSPDSSDIAYGPLELENLDFFKPTNRSVTPAPIIIMVHGGAWCIGDKAMKSVTKNKVAHWTSRGFIFVSVNYPMLNDGLNAYNQAREIARATAYVQNHASEWGGDPARVILMGHSAGAHLISLVNADGILRTTYGVKPLLGAVSLDAGAINVPVQMPQAYSSLHTIYHEAFGDDEASWEAASPYHRLDKSAAPWLGVCSTQRKDNPCDQAKAFANKFAQLGIAAATLPVDKSHRQINDSLGDDADYTAAVDKFIAALDPETAKLLQPER